MANPLFNTLGGNVGGNDLLQQFLQFKKQMNGINPHEEVNKLLQSGRLSQTQLNQVQQIAQRYAPMFGK